MLINQYLFPIELSKLSDIVKNGVVKKDAYNAKIKDIEDKILDITNLAPDTILNAKINEVKNEILSITNLAIATILNAKIMRLKAKYLILLTWQLSVLILLLKRKHLMLVILSKKLTITQKLVKLKIKLLIILIVTNIFQLKNLISLRSENFTARQANLARKGDVANFVKKLDFNNKLKDVTSNKNELNEVSKKSL